MYSYEKRKVSKKNVFLIILLMIVTAVTSIYLYKMYEGIKIDDLSNGNYGEKAIRLGVDSTEEAEIKTNILEETTKCVVGISKIKSTGDSILTINATENYNLGTGTIISDNGYILTNWHLVGNKYSSCYVTLENGYVHSGNVVWADEDLDLAIVKITANGLNYLKLGDSDNIKIGEQVYAIGNPIGLEFQRTVTAGIISGINRTIKIEEGTSKSYMEGLIQTDASINRGNSGGPLVNAQGEIIGINSVKIESAEGIGFAIPINIVKPIIESFINTGNFEEAYLGISAYDNEVIRYLQNNVEFENGIYVVNITKDGPISKTNIKIGDLITKIDGKNINKMSDLREYIYRKKPGDIIKITYTRNSKEYEIDVTLGRK